MKKIIIFLYFIFLIFFLITPKNILGVSGSDCINSSKCPVCGDGYPYFCANNKCSLENNNSSCNAGVDPISCHACDTSQEYCNLGVGCRPLPTISCSSPNCVTCSNNYYVYEIRSNYYKCCPNINEDCPYHAALKPNCGACPPLPTTCSLCPTCETGYVWNRAEKVCCPSDNPSCSGIAGQQPEKCEACADGQLCTYEGRGCITTPIIPVDCSKASQACQDTNECKKKCSNGDLWYCDKFVGSDQPGICKYYPDINQKKCQTDEQCWKAPYNLPHTWLCLDTNKGYGLCSQPGTPGERYEEKYAARPIKPLFCDESKNIINSSIGCIPTDSQALIAKLLPWIMGLAGGVAFILMLAGAFTIMTSTGNPEKLKAGQERLTSAIIGLLLVIFAVFLMRIIGLPIMEISK